MNPQSTVWRAASEIQPFLNVFVLWRCATIFYAIHRFFSMGCYPTWNYWIIPRIRTWPPGEIDGPRSGRSSNTSGTPREPPASSTASSFGPGGHRRPATAIQQPKKGFDARGTDNYPMQYRRATGIPARAYLTALNEYLDASPGPVGRRHIFISSVHTFLIMATVPLRLPGLQPCRLLIPPLPSNGREDMERPALTRYDRLVSTRSVTRGLSITCSVLSCTLAEDFSKLLRRGHRLAAGVVLAHVDGGTPVSRHKMSDERHDPHEWPNPGVRPME